MISQNLFFSRNNQARVSGSSDDVPALHVHDHLPLPPDVLQTPDHSWRREAPLIIITTTNTINHRLYAVHIAANISLESGCELMRFPGSNLKTFYIYLILILT